MSVPFIPGVEAGTSSEGTIEINEEHTVSLKPKVDTDFKQPSIKRSEILDFGDQGFLLHSILTQKECQFFIDEGEKLGFEAIRGARDDYRSCKRITLQSEELAHLLWTRVSQNLCDVTIQGDPHLQHVHGPNFLLQGKWKPVGINYLFRLCRYLPGGHFAPHFDGHYDKSPDERSLKTLMIYLNGDFNGGSTNFVNDNQTLYKDESGKYCAENKNILCRIQPEAGLAILFNHHRLHEGGQLGDGVKYILRTDVMYKNSQPSSSTRQQEAIQLLQQAETLENAGDCMAAMTLYRRAFKLSPELEKSV